MRIILLQLFALFGFSGISLAQSVTWHPIDNSPPQITIQKRGEIGSKPYFFYYTKNKIYFFDNSKNKWISEISPIKISRGSPYYVIPLDSAHMLVVFTSDTLGMITSAFGTSWHSVIMPEAVSLLFSDYHGSIYMPSGKTVIYSHDLGQTWIQSPLFDTSKSSEIVRIVCPFPNLILALSVSSILYVSRDSGRSWSYYASMPPSFEPTLTCRNNVIIANGYFYPPLISQDTGHTWQPLQIPKADSLFYSAAISADNRILIGVYTAATQAIFLSNDLGITWSKMDVGRITSNTGFGFDSSGGMYADLEYSSDNGKTWHFRVNGIYETPYNCLVQLNNDSLLVGNGYIGDTLGANWRKIPVGFSDVVRDERGYLWTDEAYRSKDEGETWVRMDTNADLTASGCIAINRPGSLHFGSGSENALNTTDDGATWFDGYISQPGDVTYRMTALHDTIYCLTTEGLFFSWNNGLYWHQPDLPFFDRAIALGTDSSGSILIADTTGTIWHTDNAGLRWDSLFHIPHGYASCFTTLPDGSIYIGTSADSGSPFGVVRSLDSGRTWQTVNTGLANDTGVYPKINSLRFSARSHRLYMATADHGLFVSDTITLRVPKDSGTRYVESPNNLSPMFSLSPNPARASLRVEGVGQPVEAELTDELGRNTLEPALYTLPFTLDVKSIPSGVYYLRLSQGGFVQTRRVVIER
jgi:photosystem II stability/assembly factor-like uncharacterized protein